MTYALIFISFVFISETFYPHENLIYVEDNGDMTMHYLPHETVFDEKGLINYTIFDLYGW